MRTLSAGSRGLSWKPCVCLGGATHAEGRGLIATDARGENKSPRPTHTGWGIHTVARSARPHCRRRALCVGFIFEGVQAPYRLSSCRRRAVGG